MGSANVTAPLAGMCRQHGLEVVVITEGLASKTYEDAGFSPYFKGTANWRVEPFTLMPDAVLETVKPDAVVVGLGWPIHLEETFALAANRCKIPLVMCADFWNCVRRNQAVPQLVLAIDEVDARLSSELHKSALVRIVGNPGVPAAPIAPAPEVAELRKSCENVYTFIGGGVNTGKEIEFLVECLKLTTGRWRLIPRFHPKYAKLKPPGGSETYNAIWREMLQPFEQWLAYIDGPRTDAIVVASDLTVSALSTLLATSAQAGKVAVSLDVPTMRDELDEIAGIQEFPLVTLGCAHRVREPVDLSTLAPMTAEHLAKLKPYDARVAYQDLAAFLGV